jgi:hypothetical protein
LKGERSHKRYEPSGSDKSIFGKVSSVNWRKNFGKKPAWPVSAPSLNIW